jgi:glycosyltransferase involved in cell wall biosynthesis
VTPPPIENIEAVAVVVPVRDEQELLGRCLDSLEGALARPGGAVPASVTIVLDGCTDGSAAIAGRYPFPVLELDGVGVGRSRREGVAAALARLPGVPRERVWVANTDADSAVPADWLVRHLELADSGWDAVLGTVVPDARDLPPELRGGPLSVAARTGAPVYGANLGVRASSYAGVGGFAAVREHEDARLVAALHAAGARVTSAYDLTVLTSGRAVGRAPGGYAGFLSRAAAAARVAQDVLAEETAS